MYSEIGLKPYLEGNLNPPAKAGGNYFPRHPELVSGSHLWSNKTEKNSG